ncbi:cardiolipin synthase [Nocardioides yefusunii]|uniref:Cardiolipin synthase n=1 Tax=Nocardioides yefusunii TaxID=2500546 RepID=A0ABW1QWN6_9ACTN|nr:cardiolipin synthase [Nocardioides yefusunii]
MQLSDWTTWPVLAAATWVVVDLSMRFVALGVIPGRRKPSTGMAWLLLVLLNPVIGLLGFSFFGTNRVGRRRHDKIAQVNELIRSRTEDVPEPATASHFRPAVHGTVALNRQLGALPLLADNTIRFEPDYTAALAAMTRRVEAAQHYVDVEFYIAALDDETRPFFTALADAVQRGVTVRFLFDHIGSRGIPGHEHMVKFLDEAGIDWHAMLPIKPLKGKFRRPDLRNHRKLVVVDGQVGFTGSLNLTEPGYNKPKNHKAGRKWVELVVELEGPAVASLEAVFASDWWVETDEVLHVRHQGATGQVAALDGAISEVTTQLVPSGPGYPTDNTLRLFTSLMYAAERRLSITSPYFVPDESLLYAVTTAAQRGVEVELFVCEQADQFMVGHAQASYYRELLEAGVRIHLYPKPYVLHSKHFSVDDDVAVIGSSNMDPRSFALNYELSLVLFDDRAVTAMRGVEDTYRELSRELTLAAWESRPRRQKYLDNVFRLTSALQ